MVPLALFGYIMCNVLLAWIHYISHIYQAQKQALSSPLPQNKNEWVHSVIFEPQPKIQFDSIIIQSDILS